ncbi:mitochondrial carrier domain-containing protein [Fimicolochytrium jonesii]|uniref:mitochondrial carrier domain-containing protein n=1 Tax=Fimicolochytrium jonesii TaxID=1396493 RepID=UPI0022FE3FB8|nr:mitochondrial carrier domain-containing protein [Fimicolochytrium jonesii]KAI8827247.1 mitochondrial carrier domain-containing protein [Fimicolochytrium jonesii]
MAIATMTPAVDLRPGAPVKKKPLQVFNLAIGAALNIFEVSTLGQPFEVIKTHMAANRGDTMPQAIAKTWKRGGGPLGFYQGLIPWAWLEASTKGAVLMFAASEVEYLCRKGGAGPAWAGVLGGMAGGITQAYTTMGVCTFMKTVEVTRHKAAGSGPAKSTIQVARDIFAKEGIRGINKGVNAVAVRQCTNWGSRFGLSRVAENGIRKATGNEDRPLSPYQRILASAIGGGMSCWNQPIEVIRVEMQSQVQAAGRPTKMTIGAAAKWIYQQNGFKGFYRGVVPRVGLGVWQTVCMVFGGDSVKAYFAAKAKH